MTTPRFVFLLVSAVLFSAIWGCAAYDRVAVTKFEPIRTEPGAQVFRFTAYADMAYPLKSEEAERIRIDWLET